MPLPVLFGLPLLWTIITSAITTTFAFLLQYISRKFAEKAVVLASLLALTTVFWGAVSAVVLSLEYMAPPQLALALSFVVPANAKACISVCFTARIARAVYDWHKKLLAPSSGYGY